MMYDVMTTVKQVENFLNKISAKFILAVMPCNSEDHDLKTHEFVSNLGYAIMMYDIHDYTFLDLGDDGLHPGPLQHIEYANKILKVINETRSS